jgi:hypothetical protein
VEEPADSGGRQGGGRRAADRFGLGRHGLLDRGQRRPQQPQVRGRGRAGLGPPVHEPDRGVDEVGLLDDLVEQAEG